MNPYNNFQTSYFQSDFHPDNYNNSGENPKRKRDEYESYKFIDDEEQISSDSEEDEELQLMQGYQPDRKRTKSSTSTIPSTNLHNNLSLQSPQQHFLNNNNNIHHHNNESGSIVENNQDDGDCMMDDEESYLQQEEPSLFVPPNLQNDPYSIQQFEYKRRQVYNHYRIEKERKMEEIELKQSMKQGETNFRLNPILRYLHNERKNRINSPFE